MPKEFQSHIYARIDVHLCENDKIARAGKQSELVGWLHIAGICYAKRNNTDGFIPYNVAPLLTFSAKKLLKIITKTCGLWDETEGGFLIHHYEEWQETSSEIDEKRAAKVAAGRLGGINSGISRSNPSHTNTTKQNGSTCLSKNEADASSKREASAQAKGQAKTKQNEAYEDEEKEEDKKDPLTPSGGTRPSARVSGSVMAAWFAQFWGEYPKKVGKDAALAKFKVKVKDEATFDAVMIGLERSRSSAQWCKDGGQFIPHPATWLNQGRWTDEAATLNMTGPVVAPSGHVWKSDEELIPVWEPKYPPKPGSTIRDDFGNAIGKVPL